jgi:hypothetical protein
MRNGFPQVGEYYSQNCSYYFCSVYDLCVVSAQCVKCCARHWWTASWRQSRFQIDPTVVADPAKIKDASAPNLIQDSLRNAFRSAISKSRIAP